ncbi:YqhA family protein [Deinococcus sp. Marseille-Q6407]|uniref:YqhA family protein n=1 Tax=Deinococcus sp. Marseille-Q6407 TaxID=2969223 RepID=UPI0021C1E457|nr:YqhA family protein [Deinococcus sp. Marseille-Q6407]
MSQHREPPASKHDDTMSELIGRTRFVVVLAVLAVLLVALSLFIQGTLVALWSIYETWHAMLTEGVLSQKTDLAVEFLEVVSTMLKAVVFYIIGLGMYSLFIRPLNITSALGIESLGDLEQKIVSVIMVILGVTFLQHYVNWENPQETLLFALSFALAGGVIVLFQKVHHGKGDLQQPETKLKARRELFENEAEQREIGAEDVCRAERATQAEQSGASRGQSGAEEA